MKNVLLLSVLFLLHTQSFSGIQTIQKDVPQDLHFEVLRVYPPIAPSKAELMEANTLADLNPHFRSEWIRSYISTSVTTIQKGKAKTDAGKSETLTADQKAAILLADIGSEVSVTVKYIPENNLKHNEPKEMNFSFIQEPEFEATFPGGKEKMLQYLKRNAIDKIPEGSFEGYDLATIGFTINEEGHISEAHVFWPFKEERIDKLLLETISNMPKWKPGQYTTGKKVKQEFVLTVGNMQNCVIHMLHVKRDS